MAYILAPIEGCDDRGYQTDPAQGLTGVKAIDDSDAPGHACATRSPTSPRRWVTRSLRSRRSTTSTRSAPRRYARSPSARAPTSSSPGAVARRSRWSRTRPTGTPRTPAWVDEVDLPIYDDVETMWAAFQDGELDCSQAPPDQVPAITCRQRGQGRHAGRPRSWPAAALYFVGMNMTDPTLGPEPRPAQGRQRSRRTRRRWSTGSARASPRSAGGYVPAGIPGYKAAQNPYPYDLEAATKRGHRVSAPSPTLNYWYDTSEDHRLIADALVAGWGQAGLSVEASDYEWGTFLDKLSRGNKGSGSQLFRVAWIADYPAMDAFLYPLFQSDQSPTGSYTFYSNQGVDDLLQKARATTGRAAAAQPLRPGREAHPHRHACRPAVLLPLLPCRRRPGARVHRRPHGHHRHAGGVGRVGGSASAVDCICGVKLTSWRWERHSAHEGRGRCVTEVVLAPVPAGARRSQETPGGVWLCQSSRRSP